MDDNSNADPESDCRECLVRSVFLLLDDARRSGKHGTEQSDSAWNMPPLRASRLPSGGARINPKILIVQQ
jgi:hypothetical protein